MAPEGLYRAGLGPDRIGDLAQPEPQFPEQQNLLQPQQLLHLVVAVAVGSDIRRGQQADPVVVPQGSCRYAGHPRDVRDRPGHIPFHHRPDDPATFATIGADVTSRSSAP
jgi:hypothetical protein